MHDRLTEPQQKIYAFIRAYIQDNDRPPTNREIGLAVSIRSTGHVDHHLNALEDKGYIERVRGKSRGIRLTERGLPVIGTIAAGDPITYFPDAEVEYLDMGANTRRTFMLRVKGDSMVDDHIASGDYVLIKPDGPFFDGDIVVATHTNDNTSENGSATLKRFYRESGRVRLQPANADYSPIYIDGAVWEAEWKIQGKVSAVYRQC
ncbi:MAG TPA: transcriptional repressor LexA [Ktedonobacterales bacterium]